MRRLIPVLLVIVTSTLALVDAQDLGRRLGGANGPTPVEAAPNKPAPNLPDGTVDLSGVWTGGGDGEIPTLLKPGELDQILLPKTKQLMESRDRGSDPYNYC